MATDWSKVPWTPFREVTTASPPPEIGAQVVVENSRYMVFIRLLKHPRYGEVCHLSIKTHDKAAYHDWRDFQRIKDEICGPEFEAVEIYPQARYLVDTSNQYHLWVFLEHRLELGFTERLVAEGSWENSVQRPFEADNRPPDLLTADELADLVSRFRERRHGV